MEALIQTFGENISLSIPPEASIPVLVGKKTQGIRWQVEGNGWQIQIVRGEVESLRRSGFTSVSNAKKTLSDQTTQYYSILEGWKKQFKVQMARLEGKVQQLEAERSHAVVRHAGEREALERELGEAETELARAREAHTAKVKRVLDKAASSKGARDWDSDRCEVEEANCRNDSHFNQGKMDDNMRVGSETLLPDLEPQQQAASTQVDASDGMSCLTDPTSPNLAFTLPQMATRINPFPHQLPQQAAGNVEEAIRRNESLEAENSEEDEEHDFGQGNNEY